MKLTTCGLCTIHANCDPHHVFPGTARQISDRYGAVIYLCRTCHRKVHDHPKAYKWLQAKVQAEVMFRNGWGMDEWMEHFHKNYL